MATISISNLQSHDSQSSLILFETEELKLIQTAVNRSLDTRKVVGGFGLKTCGRKYPMEF